MSQDLTAFGPEYWSNEMQIIRFKENVAIALCNTEQREKLSDGDTLNKPYRSQPRAQTYTKGTDMTIKDRSGTNEYLSVDTAKVVPFYVDDLDKIQNKWDMASKFAGDGQRQLNNILDQAVFGRYSDANNSVDDGDVGGTSGNAIVPSVSNIQKIFAAMARQLDNADVVPFTRWVGIGSRILELLRLYLAGKDTGKADQVGDNGRVMERFGFNLYYSNNCPWTATLGIATNPSEGDTVVIAGVTFTFAASPSSANDVDIGGSAAVSVDNLVAAINDTGTAGTTYIQLSDDDRWKLVKNGIVATDATTSITFVGYGDIVTSETLTDTTDAWSSEQQYMLGGAKDAIDLVVQKDPQVDFRWAEKKLGRYVYPWMLYGIKTFHDMKDALVYATLDTTNWT